MDTFKTVLLFVMAFLGFGFNFYLSGNGVGIFVRSSPDADPWSVSCSYYKPVHIFTLKRSVGSECPTFSREPG